MFLGIMINSDRKRIKINATSLKYLYEIAAIPVETRQQFLQKLLKRKNSSGQKNVRLLKIIYYHITEEKMLEWDEENICNVLSISKNMLYCHKSYLLKGLRLTYFNWKEIEKKEFDNPSGYKNELSYEFSKAERMNRLGMNRESKNEFLKIEKKINLKKIKSLEEKLILLQIMHRLNYHYYIKKDRRKFIDYTNRFMKIASNLSGLHSIKSNRKLYYDVMQKIYNLKTRVSIFGSKVDGLNDAIHYSKLSLKVSKRTSIETQVMHVFNLAKFYINIPDYESAKKYCMLGLKLTRKKKLKSPHLNFESLLNAVKVYTHEISVEQGIHNIKVAYGKTRYSDVNLLWREGILFDNITVLSRAGKNTELLYNILYDYTSISINTKGFYETLRVLYYMKFSYYLTKIRIFETKIDKITGKRFLSVTSTDEKYVKKLAFTVSELMINANKDKGAFFEKEAYVYMLSAEFWNGLDCNIEYANHLMAQIRWHNKTKKITATINQEQLDALFLAMTMMSESKYMNKKNFLVKYEQKLESLLKEVLNYGENNSVSIYSFISFMSEQIGHAELKNICKHLFWSIEKKFPKIFEEIYDQIEERKNEASKNMFLISNPIAAA